MLDTSKDTEPQHEQQEIRAPPVQVVAGQRQLAKVQEAQVPG